MGLDSQYAFQEVAYALHNGWLKVGKLTLPFQRLAALEEAIASDPQILRIKLKKKSEQQCELKLQFIAKITSRVRIQINTVEGSV